MFETYGDDESGGDEEITFLLGYWICVFVGLGFGLLIAILFLK